MSFCSEVYVGNIVTDLEVKTTKNGGEILDFSIAIKTGYGDYEKTNFMKMIAFGKSAVNIAKYFAKGGEILLRTEPNNTEWHDKEGKKHVEYKHSVLEWDFTRGSKKIEQVGSDFKMADSSFINIPDGLGDEMPFA